MLRRVLDDARVFNDFPFVNADNFRHGDGWRILRGCDTHVQQHQLAFINRAQFCSSGRRELDGLNYL